MNVIAYIRVSSIGQKDNTSLDGQEESIARHCGIAGHTLVSLFRESVSASGEFERKELKKALKALYAGAADGLIVYRLDRLARSTVEGLKIVQQLRKHGKQLVIMDLQLDTSTPIGEMMLTILLGFAQLERKIIGERTREGKQRVREKNGYVHGQAPYGWMSQEVSGRRWLVRNEHQQYWRNFILEKRKEGWTFQKIADELNNRGIKSKRGIEWAQSSVRQVCNRPSTLIDWINSQEKDDNAVGQ